MTINLKLPSSWKTTLFGVISAVAGYVALNPSEFPHWMNVASSIVASGALAGLGLSAKDSNVTGGTTPNTSNDPTAVQKTAETK